jgi:hypothetical protein
MPLGSAIADQIRLAIRETLNRRARVAVRTNFQARQIDPGSLQCHGTEQHGAVATDDQGIDMAATHRWRNDRPLDHPSPFPTQVGPENTGDLAIVAEIRKGNVDESQRLARSSRRQDTGKHFGVVQVADMPCALDRVHKPGSRTDVDTREDMLGRDDYTTGGVGDPDPCVIFVGVLGLVDQGLTDGERGARIGKAVSGCHQLRFAIAFEHSLVELVGRLVCQIGQLLADLRMQRGGRGPFDHLRDENRQQDRRQCEPQRKAGRNATKRGAK